MDSDGVQSVQDKLWLESCSRYVSTPDHCLWHSIAATPHTLFPAYLITCSDNIAAPGSGVTFQYSPNSQQRKDTSITEMLRLSILAGLLGFASAQGNSVANDWYSAPAAVSTSVAATGSNIGTAIKAGM